MEKNEELKRIIDKITKDVADEILKRKAQKTESELKKNKLFTEKDIKEILEGIDEALELEPVLKKIAENIFVFTPYIKELLYALSDFKTEMVARSFNGYLSNNFSREEAMVLTLKGGIDFQDILSNMYVKFNKQG